MDNAPAQPASPASSGQHSTIRLREHSPSNLPEPTQSRQQRLLEGRNARFAAKKLSMSDLGAKFTQFIHANEEPQGDKAVRRNQENQSTRQRKTNSIGKGAGSTRSFGILQEISGSTRSRKIRKRASIPLYQDNQERPLLDCSPFSSPVVYRDTQSATGSPIGFDHFHDNLSTMQLREVSGNEHRGSPIVGSPLNGSLKAIRKRKYTSFKPAFDAQEYIEHIENELHQANQDMFSPRSNKSLRDQLKNLKHENERLRTEISSMRDVFECEVKRTVEHKMAVEAELMMKVRDLEEELDKKNFTVQELENNHKHRRLDSNTVDTFKIMIERLEREKLAIEDENKNMSKRNEVLSELLAMSPTKSQAFFELRSPVRTKRSVRPMSMILPRLPSSPTFKSRSQPPSVNTSPTLSTAQPVNSSLASERVLQDQSEDERVLCGDYTDTRSITEHSMDIVTEQSNEEDALNPDATTLPQIPSSPPLYSVPLPVSVNDESIVYRPPQKRKPRKFVSGSTQLKPLLLPALNVDTTGPGTSSDVASPQSRATRDFSQDSFDPTTYFLTQPSSDSILEMAPMNTTEAEEMVTDRARQTSDNKFQTFEEILMEHKATSADNISQSEPASSLPPSPCPGIYRNEMRSNTVDDVGKGDQRIRVVPTSPRTFRQRLEEVSPAPRSCSEASVIQTISSSPLSESLDLVNLDHLEFVELDFDYFSRPGLGLHERASVDVPEPLFSPVSRNTHQARLSGSLPGLTALSTDPFLPPPTTVKIQQSPLDVRELIPPLTPQPVPSPELDAPSPVECQNACNSSLIDEEQGVRINRRSSMTMHNSTSALRRSKNPLEIMHERRFGAKPLAALTIRTIYGTLSRCTTYVRDFKQDPLALARRVIANAWFTNWTRFGRLSWWVLGLFITPARQQTLLGWDWDQYDAENIAQEVQENNADTSLHHVNYQGVNSDQSHGNLSSTAMHDTSTISTSEQSTNNQKLGWGASLFLWGKFSVAIMLAVGGAVVKGPGEMLKDMEQQQLGPQSKKAYPPDKHATCGDSNQSVNNTLVSLSAQEQTEQQFYSTRSIDTGGVDIMNSVITQNADAASSMTTQLLQPELSHSDYGTLQTTKRSDIR